jgi:hypothetical protein
VIPLFEAVLPIKNDGDLIDLLYRYATSAAIKREVLVDNPAWLFDFNNPSRENTGQSVAAVPSSAVV